MKEENRNTEYNKSKCSFIYFTNNYRKSCKIHCSKAAKFLWKIKNLLF